MAVTTATTVDVAQVLSAALADVDGLRVEPRPSDKARPPVAIIAQPSIDYRDPEAGFCRATYEFPIAIVTASNNDRDAQLELWRLADAAALAVDRYDTGGTGVFSMTVLRSDPLPGGVTIAGQELPAYQLRVQVRA
jgi:hypothetical protein